MFILEMIVLLAGEVNKMNNLKQIGLIYIILISLLTTVNLYMPNVQAVNTNPDVIPSDAIRLRILANSNTQEDQQIKLEVKDAVNIRITELVSTLTSKEEARSTIINHLGELETIATEIVRKYNNDTVTINFTDVEFPTKLYGTFLYPAGIYEAVLITIGEGEGENWWCVLFPPLCFVDFSKGATISEGFEDEEGEVVVVDDTQVVETKFFLIEWFKKLFS